MRGSASPAFSTSTVAGSPEAVAFPGARAAIAGVWLLGWALLAAVAVQDHLRGGAREIWPPLVWEGTSMLFGTVVLLLQLRLARRNDALLATPWRWFARQLTGLPIACLLFPITVFPARHAIYALLDRTYQPGPWREIYVYESGKIAVFYVLIALVIFGLRSYVRLADERRRLAQAEAALREAQLHRLAQQLQPHFLFNALNLVSSVMHTDVNRADALLDRLGQLLRASMDGSLARTVPLAEELALLRAYAEIMRERFVDRVELAIEVGPGLEAARLPPMTLQPLLENVFRHTVERRTALTRIAVRLVREGDTLVAVVEDDAGTLAPDRREGIGTGNVRRRLAALYGAGAEFRLEPLAPAGVRATVRVPLAETAS